MKKLVNQSIMKARIAYRNYSVQRNSNKILHIVKTVLDDTDYLWFMDFGTLLGIVRNGRILSWDGDIDIGIVVAKDADDILSVANKFVEKGLKIRAINYYHDIPTIIKLVYKKASVDLHLYFQEGDKLICYLHQTKGKIPVDDLTVKKRVNLLTCSTISDIVNKTVYDMEVPVPSNYETILAEKYGESWMIENRNWKSENTPNLVVLDDYGIVKRYIKKTAVHKLYLKLFAH